MKTAAVVCITLAALAAATGAQASPVTYDYAGGAIDITGLTVDGTSVLPSGSMPTITLSGSSTATLDTSADTLSFAISQGSPLMFALCCSVTVASNTFSFASAEAQLSGLVADSIGSLALTSNGGGNFSFNSGSGNGVNLSGTGELLGVTDNGASIGTLGPRSWGPAGKPISGNVAVSANGQDMVMDGVPLGSFVVDGQTVAVTGNIIFEGAVVPLPATAWLLGSALGLLLAGRQLQPARPLRGHSR